MSGSSSSFNVSWTNSGVGTQPVNNIVQYRIPLQTQTFTDNPIGSTTGSTQSVGNLIPATNYDVRVKAFNQAGSAFSVIVQTNTSPLPSGPIIITGGQTPAQTFSDAAGVTWNISAGMQVVHNGTVDTTTSQAVQMVLINGNTVWYQDLGNHWFSKVVTAAVVNGGWLAGSAPIPATNILINGGQTPAQTFTDSFGIVWSISAGQQVTHNGVADTTTAAATQMLLVNGVVIWYKTSSGAWSSKAAASVAVNGGWTQGVAPTPIGTIVIQGGQTPPQTFVDAFGIVWGISAGQQVTFNGTIDTVTAQVTQMALTNNGTTIWQGNSLGAWYFKPAVANPAGGLPDTWTQGASPIPVNTVVIIGGQTPPQTFTDAFGVNWFISAGQQCVFNGTVDTDTGLVVEMALLDNGNTIWQQNLPGDWYFKAATATPAIAGWTQGADPLAGAGTPTPPAASAAGYTRQVFGPSLALGANWFKWAADVNATQNANGSITTTGGNNNFGLNVITALPSGGANWTGSTWTGGAYFEWTMSFTGPANPASIANGWPSLWLVDMEGPGFTDGTLARWQGQAANYYRWATVNVAEWANNHTPMSAANTVYHEFSDYYSTVGSNTQVQTGYNANGSPYVVPAGFSFSQPHKYGLLWVPATATSQGYARHYIDDVRVDTGVAVWNQYNQATSPPPVAGTTAWSFIDSRHIAAIFGTGPQNPLTVTAFSVWQR